jgi:CDP-diacylglycerol---glycerol-3-phosphate 3-phosphatidyltransferase
MSLYRLKSIAARGSVPLARGLGRLSVTPNEITILTIVLMLLTGVILVMWAPATPGVWLLLPVMLLIRVLLNLIDGVLARECQLITPLGGLLSVMGDVIADVALYLPLVIVPKVSVTLVVVMICLVLMTEVAGLAALTIGAERNHSGPLGKVDRCLVFGIMGILLGISRLSSYWLNVSLALVILFLLMTIIRRLQTAMAEVGYHL